MRGSRGYILIMLLVIITIMGIGLMVAVPVWQTEIQREQEAELIFRGNQYVEAVRIFQTKNPGRFPKTLEELLKTKCIRRVYKDPMTPEGEWNVILHQEGVGGRRGPAAGSGSRLISTQVARQQARQRQAQQQGRPEGFTAQKVMVAPLKVLSSIQNAQILGVVSASTKKSIRVYEDGESYDKWLFYYGHDSNQKPEIVYYGQTAKTP
jgi:hypothetical protein